MTFTQQQDAWLVSDNPWAKAWRRAAELFPTEAVFDTADVGIDYSCGAMPPMFDGTPWPDAADDNQWLDNASTLATLFELGYWYGRAQLDDEWIGATLMQCYRHSAATLPYLTDELVLAAVKAGARWGTNEARYGASIAWSLVNRMIRSLS